MRDLWNRLLDWHARREHQRPFRPRPPATASAIAAAEDAMKISFPEDFRASLLVHDGEDDYDGDPMRFHWMPGCDRLAPLAQIVEQWRDERDRVQDEEEDSCLVTEDGRFRNLLWHSKRIPIAGSPWWDGDNTYLDFVPGPEGAAGQLVTMVTECDFVVLAPSFRAAFEGYVEMLESGEWQRQAITGHSAGVFAELMARKSAAKKGS